MGAAGCPDARPRPSGHARDRLIDAVIRVAADRGYGALTVQLALDAAGVSRASFYQYFTSIEDCFWGAYAIHQELLVADAAAAAARAPGGQLGALKAIVTAAAERPQIARLLACEAIAAGPAGLRARDETLAALARIVQGAAAGGRLDLPPVVAVAAALGVMAMRLDGGEDTAGLAGDVTAWASTFTVRGPASWSSAFTPPMSDPVRRPAAGGPPRSRDGTRRERLLRATAYVIRENGSGGATIADIAKAAGMSRRSFYNEFADRNAALIAAYEDGFQRTLAACAPAFFNSNEWPERVWSSAHAFTGFLAREPLIAHLGFIEC